MQIRAYARASVLFALLMGLGSCGGEQTGSTFQGYGEGEFVYLSTFEAGTIKAVAVKRGDAIKAGDLLFTLDDTVQANHVREAEGQLEVARHQLTNLLTGKREQEIAVLIAGQKRAAAALKLSTEQRIRKIQLRKDGIISPADLDQAQAEFDRDTATLDELNAQITTARLTARVDEIGAAEATVQSAKAGVETARWLVQQRSVSAPKDGRIEDVLYDVGELVQPGQPVVSLLPTNAIKVRFFIPESVLGTVHEGQAVIFTCDGCPTNLVGTVRYIANAAEFTPPVIFSQPSQQKLVFMAEAWPANNTAIHPGQPVEVRLAP